LEICRFLISPETLLEDLGIGFFFFFFFFFLAAARKKDAAFAFRPWFNGKNEPPIWSVAFFSRPHFF